MFNKNFKKSLIILVACLMLALVVFTACDPTDKFTPVATDGISGKTAQGNGGVAVKYGDYIYYVNGFIGDALADNSYTNTIRAGSIVRVKATDLDAIIALNDDEIAERIQAAVKEKVQLVVPCFYFSANETNTSLTGIYIFNDRLYITTPNQTLTDGGQKLTNQLVLESYKLDGSDRKQHYVFAGSAWDVSTVECEIMLSEVNGQVFATYFSEETLYSVKALDGTVTTIAEEISNVTFDGANNTVFYMDKDEQICQFNAGASEGKVLVEKVDTETSKLSYTIEAVSDGYIYYSQADEKNGTLDGLVIYYAHFDGTNVVKGVVLNATPSGTWFGWGAKAIYVETETHGSTTAKTHTVYATYVQNGQTKKEKLFDSRDAVTLLNVEGGKLFYTVNDETFVVELGTTNEAVFYAKGLGNFTATGWAEADVVDNYIFYLGNNYAGVVAYDAEEKVNSTATNITLVEEVEE